MRLDATIYMLDKPPLKTKTTDFMRTCESVLGHNPEEWALDANTRNGIVVVHRPMRTDLPVNQRVSFVAGAIIHGPAIIFLHHQMLADGYVQAE